MTIKQRFNRLITAGFEHGDDIFLLRRLVLITSLLSMIIFLFSFFTVYNFYSGHTKTALLDASGLIICLTAMYQLQRHKRLELAINIVVFALFVFLLVFAHVNQNHSYGLIWTFFFPVFTVLLKGQRTGTMIVVAFYFLLLSSAFHGIGSWQGGQWDITSFIRFSLALVVIYYSAYFNELSLQRSYRELQETRRREKASAEQHHEEMVQLLDTKQQLMMDISHELRTPLAAMRINLEAVEDGLTDEKEGYTLLHRKLSQMNKLIEDIYQLSRGDVGALKFQQQPVHLAALLKEVCSSFDKPAQEEGLRLSCRVNLDEAITLLGDEERLFQLLSNLLHNSLHYTDRGGSLTLLARCEGDVAQIIIQDSPPGVPEEHIPRLFERFYRVDKSRSRSTGGSGLGLAICKTIVEHHGGNITAGPSPLGGLQITIHLPIKE